MNEQEMKKLAQDFERFKDTCKADKNLSALLPALNIHLIISSIKVAAAHVGGHSVSGQTARESL